MYVEMIDIAHFDINAPGSQLAAMFNRNNHIPFFVLHLDSWFLYLVSVFGLAFAAFYHLTVRCAPAPLLSFG
jgi:hypothetical protein